MPSYYQIPEIGRMARSHTAFYDELYDYYVNNGLYDEPRWTLDGSQLSVELLKPFRNPANRAVEFYAAKLWAGPVSEAFEIVAENESIVPAIEKVWTWSNWQARKQVAARWYALWGDMFLKIAQSDNGERIFFQNIKPRYVTDFDEDERGFLTYIRLDIPQVRRQGDKVFLYQYTEVWDKAAQTFRVWEHDKTPDTPLERLGPPAVLLSMAAFGIDFLPFVHAKFRDVGEKRGLGCFAHALDKIDEANRLVTRLHLLLFRHDDVTWALRANQVDNTGKPIPAPNVKGSDGTMKVGGTKFVQLPGNSSLEALVPNLDYASALAILDAQLRELEADLPELAYYRLREMGELSGRAVRLLLSDAVDKAKEAQNNAAEALVRADQMALTLAAQADLPDAEFQELGTYESGGLDHEIHLPEIIALNELEEMEVLAQKAALGVPDEMLWGEMGYTADEIAAMRRIREANQPDLGQEGNPDSQDRRAIGFQTGGTQEERTAGN